ncbi:hypothetical protein CFK37_08900 [Virgibacillus phasianinus]|uniref:5,10-methylene-tetrahydrofolate dehydrogenase n=1 Tax=Virgibacillus phasianinus TaxID=2017483 RepID=A0A220U2C2_9BACI|nr:hypothetical protein [Virgibacillus phasianinus]ASK62269.1 hypothetical protein CFK37_08900 [Virgibacillus phasianinus]
MAEIILGLVPSPDTPEKLADNFMEQLSDLLAEKVSNQVDWSLRVKTDVLIGAAEDAKELLDETADLKEKEGWDMAICLTDLPLFDGKDLVLADGDFERGVGQLSIPAFGSLPINRRVKKVLIQVVKEIYDHKFNMSCKETDSTTQYGMSDNKKANVSKQFFLSFIRRNHSTPIGKQMDLHLMIRPRFHAKLRVLSGMTIANRPQSIIPSFKPVVAVAFATGAYGLIFPTLWKLSGAFENWRFFGLMIGAISSIVIWIIVSHNLWEKSTEHNEKHIRKLYNRTTVATLVVAVLCYYGALFFLFLLTVLLFVPPDLFHSLAQLKDPIDFWNYAKLAWLATSIATFAGSIGVGLENDEKVRNIMYGYRQANRSKKYQREEQEKNQYENKNAEG